MNKIVTSELAGMGKTQYIKNQAKGSQIIEIFLAGEVNEDNLTRRISNAIEQFHTMDPLSICIKLDYIKELKIHSGLIDYFLFCICFLYRVPTEIGCYQFGSNVEKTYIELSNTFSKELLSTSRVLKLFSTKECREEKIMMHLPGFTISNITYNNKPDSKEQVALKFLELIKANLISKKKLDYQSFITEGKFRQLIEYYFLSGGKRSVDHKPTETFAQFQFWIRIIYMLATEMDKISNLNP